MTGADAALADLIARYDVFFIDQFGVLHDGSNPYPGAVAALRAIKAMGKPIVLIGNSGKRAENNRTRLKGLGFDEDCYDIFVSSGEVLWHRLKDEIVQSDRSLSCYFVGRDDDRSAVEGLNIQVVDDSRDAELVLLTGCRDDVDDISYYERLLVDASEAKTPCICSNPDKLALTPTGLKFGCGAVADLYERSGAPTTRIGKPYPEIYQFAIKRLIDAGFQDPRGAKTLCIGDSVEHDIAGGIAQGFDTALV